MTIALHCISHTPVYGRVRPAAGVEIEVNAAIDRSRAAVRDYAPDLIVLFAPDHYMGFFHRLMPPFCLGVKASSVGDYGTSAGALDVPADLALECASSVMSQGVDLSVSHDMQVDHGFAQPLDMLCGGIDRYPVLPIFINAVAAPVAPVARSRRLGTAVGRWLKTQGDAKRILVMGSGGLSHDPPVPTLDNASAEVRARMIAGGARSPEGQTANENRVIAAAQAFAGAEPTVGGGALLPLNPVWDKQMLSWLNDARFDDIDGLTNADISAAAGCSGHEVRTWIAAYACLAAFGAYRAETWFYRAIPEWIAGFAIAHGRPV